MELTTKEFFNQLKAKLYSSNELIDGKTYREAYINGKYTHLINHVIVPRILEENGYEHSNEYYRVDVTGWRQHENTDIKGEYKAIEFNYHEWRLGVAFEHENNSKDWSDEVIKLLYINCPLKIIVGYNDVKKRNDSRFGDAAKLALIARTIKDLGIDVSGELSVILGNCGNGYSQEKRDEDYFGYRAYLYDVTIGQFGELK